MEGCTVKCSSVISDENLINIFLSETVMRPVTSRMSLLPGMTAKSTALAEKQKWLTQFFSRNISSGRWRTSIMKAPEAKQQILKRQSGEFVQAGAWMCHTVMGNIPESGPLQPDYRDWCTATILGTSFWVWFDLWRFPWETVSKSSILLEA